MIVPVLLGLPAMLLTVPPLMVLRITPLSLGVQVSASVLSLAAVFAIVRDRMIQSGLRFFYGMLAMGAVIGTYNWGRHKKHKQGRYD
jgi:hypothetical protein